MEEDEIVRSKNGIVRSEHRIVRLKRDQMIRGQDCVSVYDFFFLMREKYVLTKKSQKKANLSFCLCLSL